MSLIRWWELTGGLTAVGLGMCAWGATWRRALRKYEFEHRSSGGVVGFTTFKESEAHRVKLRTADQLWGNGLRLFAFGFFGIFLALVYQFVLPRWMAAPK